MPFINSVVTSTVKRFNCDLAAYCYSRVIDCILGKGTGIREYLRLARVSLGMPNRNSLTLTSLVYVQTTLHLSGRQEVSNVRAG